jgi:tetratricopeptide (TPR) repeat protein
VSTDPLGTEATRTEASNASAEASRALAEAPSVDARNPWLGLASFTEETREFFYGREEEVAELARRVQRKLLTVLFGQSGLGKTSILRAGLVPKLRGQGYCPVYVRIDYAKEAPEPADQIKQAIARTARRSGEWTQAGVAVQGETLWEFLHHRDDVLHDESGATLIPLLIFDQFEEIFTLAQTDGFGRARAARFIADLADLVENRPPKEVEAKLETDDSAAERFDFARSDYRVLISLREDYLAPLEGLKRDMPSVTQNRLRLAPMTGTQALAAVMRPGRELVSEEVASAIVRFVAGGAEIANAEVEPSLLSLICRELNDTRLAQGRSEISLDLLAGSHATILSNFYERSLADQPASVRRIIEDELLTESGFRENVAEEKLRASFATAGAAPDALAALVNRRLLRIEERLDVRRVELTHDVLCGVVKTSRDIRHEREVRDASERLLVEQRDKERATRHALVRARKIAAFCSVLAVTAVIAAGFAYWSTQRARRAERLADETRATAEKARGQAEQLLGYLTDDFSREFETFGRLDAVAEFAKRQIDYFDALPAPLKDADTVRNGATAMIYYAAASRRLNHTDVAIRFAERASDILSRLRADGDRSERTAIALALAEEARISAVFDSGGSNLIPAAQQALDLVRPFAEQPHASLAARRAYVKILSNLGYLQLRESKSQDAVATYTRAMQMAAAAAGPDWSVPDMADEYAYAAGWMEEALGSLGRGDEVRAVAAQASEIADQQARRRPGDRLALASAQLIAANAAFSDMFDMHNAEAVAEGRRATDASTSLLQFDPDNTVFKWNMAVDHQVTSDASWQLGRPRQSVDEIDAALHVWPPHMSSRALVLFLIERSEAIWRKANLGDTAEAARDAAEGARAAQSFSADKRAGATDVAFVDCAAAEGRAELALAVGDTETVRSLASSNIVRIQALQGLLPEYELHRNRFLFYVGDLLGQAEYLGGDYTAAEKAMRDALAARAHFPSTNNADRREIAEVSTLLAMSLARQGRIAEAREVIAPVVKLHRDLATHNKDDHWQQVELAAALYASALTDPSKSAALLAEAGRLMASTPAEMHGLRIFTLWRDRIAAGTAGLRNAPAKTAG